MKPFRKPFSNDPLFPFDIVYKDTKSPENELPDHLHDRYEAVYVYKGKGTFFIDQRFYEMKQGDLFLIPGNSIHRAFPDSANPVTSTALFFSPSLVAHDMADESYSSLRGFELAKKRKHYKVELDADLRTATEATIENIRSELEDRSIGYRHAVILILQQWLLLLNRQSVAGPGNEPEETRIGPQWMKDILHDIAARPDGDHGLAALARRASVTGAHFSRVFKQLTGMNVTDYVNAKRIALAKEMLLETDDNVGLIAERCGFESLPHFHRQFKKMTGTTPRAYKTNRNPAT